MQLIREKKETTIRELSEKTGISEKGIEWQINKLKKEGVLRRIGPDKGGYWEVLEI